MGRKSNKHRRLKSAASKTEWNFLLEAGPGCHIARKDLPTSWIIDWEEIDAHEFEGEEVPDVAIDPEDETLSLCNVRNDYVIAYITVFDKILRDCNRHVLQQGTSTDNQGDSQPCTTLIVLCPPNTFCHLCYIELPLNKSLDDIRIDSDVQEWNRHSNPSDTHSQTIVFPLQGGPFLCTQGVGGQLTHFFAGNLHAIDFRCPIGTPLLAVGDGTVVDVKDDNTLTGVAVSNLFQWNSILIQLDDETDEASSSNGPLFVEYVHIQKANVQAGDRVIAGEVIGTSGSVGFSPEPHLHFAAYRSKEPTAETVRVFFRSSVDPKTTFLPEAGQWYDASGAIQPNKKAS